jgi:hypothetical protein
MKHDFMCIEFFSPEHYISPSKAEVGSCEQPQHRLDGDGQSEKEDCDNTFYKCVTEMNHLCVKEQVSDIIASILEQHKCSSV